MTTMTGTVLLIGDGFLALRNDDDDREIVVNTPWACRFCPGDRVCVCYDGVMTRSLPPQIAASSIWKCQ